MHYLAKLDKHRKEWGKYLSTMGANHTEDLIQDMYLRVDRYKLEDKVIKDDGTVNKTYIWYVLRTVWLAKYHYDKKFSPVDIDKVTMYVESEGFDPNKEEAFSNLIVATQEAIKDSSVDMFKRYMDMDVKSMRQMAKNENTGVMDVFYGVKEGKTGVTRKVGWMYDAWKDGNYEAIINLEAQ